MGFKVPSLKELGSFDAAKVFWHASFTSEVLQVSEIYHDVERNWEIRLTFYREEAICNMNAFIENGNLPSCLQSILKNAFESVHKAYHKLLSWKITYDPDNHIELLQYGEHYAPNNFTLVGEFNDFVWTKRFVLDSRYPIFDRFNLACCYWFDDESASLWSEIESSYGVNYDFFERQFLDKFGHNSVLISLKLLQLKNQLHRFYHLWPAEDCFLQFAFNHANEKGYEHAIKYIWQMLSFVERTAVLQNDRFFEFMSNGMSYPKDKISFFLYSQLSGNRTSELFNWTIRNRRSEIWLTLLLTPYADKIRNKIIKTCENLPLQMYSALFQSIAHRIKQHKFRFDQIMFEVLWRGLSTGGKDFVLEHESFIEFFAESKSFFNLKCIIKSLSNYQKHQCLLNNRYRGGINVLKILVTRGDFNLIQEYLQFFLIDYARTYKTLGPSKFHQDIFHKDAHLLLKYFINSSDFITWFGNKLSESEKKHVKDRINLILLNMQTSLIKLQQNATSIKLYYKAKSYCNLLSIIIYLPNELKYNCLFNDLCGAGISILHFLVKQKQFDFLQEYISVFFHEINPSTRKNTLRKDAVLLFQMFIESLDFRTWCKSTISESEAEKVNVLIDALRESLKLVDELCDQVCVNVG